MADDSWGPSPASGNTPSAGNDGGWNATPQASGQENNTRGPDTGVIDEGAPAPLPVEQKQPPQLSGWVQATPYEYEKFGRNAETEWDGNARVYEWDGEAGDVGPEFPELELQLFGDPNRRESHGLDFTK